MKAFARYKFEIWFMELAYVDKLAKDINGVQCLQVRQDLFGRTVDAKGNESSKFQRTVRAFLTMIRKKYRPKKLGSTWEQVLLEIPKN